MQLDQRNFLFRSYYAIGPMTNSKGESTSALYGFIRSLQKLQKDFSPKYLIAVFDGPDNKKSRQALYAEYKMNRKKAPQDLYDQIPWAISFCEWAGIPVLSISGVEADDTIATITKRFEKDFEIFICSGDKDLYQLVSDHVFVLHTHKDNLVVNAPKVEEIFGVKPAQMLDLLSLMGDASDNIPGVEGIGPKSASELLQKMGSLDEILAHPEKLSGKKQMGIIEQKEMALLSRQLATLDCQVEIPKEKGLYTLKEPSLLKLKEFYREMKFMSFLGNLEQTLQKNPSEQEVVSYQLIKTKEELDRLIHRLLKESDIAIDTETTDVNALLAKLVGIGFCVRPKEAFYIPCHGPMDREVVLEALRNFFAASKASFCGHNIKYDLHVLENEKIYVRNIGFDTILASYVLSPQNRQHNLDRLVLEKFNVVKIPIESLIKVGKKTISMDEVSIEKVSAYCCEDVDYTCRLKKLFAEDLKKEELEKVFYQIEIPLLPVLARMETRGIFIDKDFFSKLQVEFSSELHRLEKAIYVDVGEEFNINSPKQMGEILYHKLQLPLPKNKTLGFSTAASVLEKLAEASPVVQKILDYRGLQKLLSTYIEPLPLEIHPKTHRIHANFNQSATATGRLSCQDPNLQNIPVRSKEGQRIREGFRPQKEGWSYLSADYSQIELRLLAHFSEDPELLHAFHTGQDIHAYTASLIYGVTLESVTKEMRHSAKAVNFGILYGQGPFGLSEQLGITTKEAALFIQTYFARYKKIEPFLDKCKKEAEERGYSLTLTGRKRPLPELHNQNAQIRSAAQRLAMNTPLQGTAADIIKLAMIEVDKELDKKKYEGYMILQIHDELLFEIPDTEIEAFRDLVSEKMVKIFSLQVPLEVDIAIGKNWGEC
ncbi:MAG: DNA polymerase I [Chlamydiota bacterium]